MLLLAFCRRPNHAFHGNLILLGFGERREPQKDRARPGKQWVEGKDFHLTREVKYMQRRAAEHDGRFVTIGPPVFFSTQTGDAWMLEPSDQLPARHVGAAGLFSTQSPSRSRSAAFCDASLVRMYATIE